MRAFLSFQSMKLIKFTVLVLREQRILARTDDNHNFICEY